MTRYATRFHNLLFKVNKRPRELMMYFQSESCSSRHQFCCQERMRKYGHLSMHILTQSGTLILIDVLNAKKKLIGNNYELIQKLRFRNTLITMRNVLILSLGC